MLARPKGCHKWLILFFDFDYRCRQVGRLCKRSGSLLLGLEVLLPHTDETSVLSVGNSMFCALGHYTAQSQGYKLCNVLLVKAISRSVLTEYFCHMSLENSIFFRNAYSRPRAAVGISWALPSNTRSKYAVR